MIAKVYPPLNNFREDIVRSVSRSAISVEANGFVVRTKGIIHIKTLLSILNLNLDMLKMLGLSLAAS